VSDRAPSCPFCGSNLPAATIDRDATPARGVAPAEPHALAEPVAPPLPTGKPPAPSSPAVGSFERARPLGPGNSTWLSWGAETGTAAVVKVLRHDPDERLAAAWSSLSPHPSVVRALGFAAGSGERAVVYDYVAPDAHSRKAQGRSAFDRRLRREPIPFPEALRFGVLACRGLEHVYQGGMRGHGNLKPTNLLLGLEGGLRVSEPGLAGTESPVHLAPERFDGAPADEVSDLYSLGVVLYQMASGGQPPYDTPSRGAGEEGAMRYREALRQLHQDALLPRLDSPLAAVLERCLQKEGRNRFASAGALRAELEDQLRRETGMLPHLPSATEATGWERAQQALALLAIGRAEPALQAFEEALAVLPRTASVLSVRATALHVLSRHEDAVAGADDALAVDPQHAPAWRQKGESLAALGRHEEAASAFEQATFLAPRDAAPFVALGGLLGGMGRLPQALAAYDRAVAADPEHVDVWLARGRTLAAAGDRADAAAALLRFLDLSSPVHPARPRAEEMLAEVRGQTAPELSPLREVAEDADPGARGLELFRAGRLEEALEALDRALLADPRNPTHHVNRASVLFRWGNPTEALRGLEKALALEPRLGHAWLNKAAVEKALGRGPEARRSFADLLSLVPAPDGRILDQARSLDGALERHAVEVAPQGALSHLLAGVQHARGGRLEDAVTDFRRALTQDPLLAVAWLYKGDALGSLGRTADAAHAYEEGASADPGDVRFLLGLGRSRARLGELDTAAAVLHRALELAAGEARADASRLLEAVEGRRAAKAAQAPRQEDAPVPAVPVPHPPPAAEETVPAPLLPANEPPRETAEVWSERGRAAFDIGHFHDALACFSRALELSPDDAASWLGKAESLKLLDRFEEAREPYEEALARTPHSREALIGRGLVLRRVGSLEEAIASFAGVLEADPTDFEALHQKATGEDELERASDAARSYERFLAAAPAGDPRRPRAETRLLALLDDLKPATIVEPPAAPAATPASAPEPAVAPPPPTAVDPAAAALALLVQGRAAEALDVLDQALQAGADDASLWVARGDSLRALGRKEEAAASFDQALKRAPHDSAAWVKKGEALDAAGVFAEAIACYDQAIGLNPRHHGAWNSKGVGLTRLRRIDEALTCFARALENEPRFALARFNKAAAEDMLGRVADAVVSFEEFLAQAAPSQRAQIQHAEKRLKVLKPPPRS